MKIALVDNGSTVLENLKALLSKNNLDFNIFDYQNINLINESNYCYAILSGSSKLNVKWNKDVLESESNFVLHSNLPILGICLGFQIIATCYGCNLVENPNKINGVNKLNKIVEDPIFNGIDNLLVQEAHSWIVESVSDQLQVLAKSQNGIEIIKHVSKPIYGFQFHPEISPETSFGDELFFNFHKIYSK